MSAEITGELNESYAASRVIIQCSFDVLNVVDTVYTAKTSFEFDILAKRHTFSKCK